MEDVNWTNVASVSEDIEKVVDRISASCRTFRERDSSDDGRMRALYDMSAYSGDLAELCDSMSRFLRRRG